LNIIVTLKCGLEITFNVKEWPDLENQIRGRSRSLKIAPIDRPYATFYRSAIVNLSFTIFELFDVD